MNTTTKTALLVAGGVALGTGLAYLFDPKRGERRRSAISKSVNKAWQESQEFVGATARDAGRKARGLVRRESPRFDPRELPDRILEERVRAKLGRIVSYPRAIEVRARGGRITLSGPILVHELPRVLSQLCTLRGVTRLENQMDVLERRHSSAASSSRRTIKVPRASVVTRGSGRTSAARAIVGAASGALAIYGLRAGLRHRGEENGRDRLQDDI